MKYKNLICLLLSLITCLSIFSGCSIFNKDIPNDLESRPEITDIKESGAYVLTAKNGQLVLFRSEELV